ncbi:MAG: SRPBCC family protein [Ilumatobacter sp.]|nr:SRPBCC family protein [Ilumatobacter sp.]
MVEVVEESRIARPADAVWATLADFDGIARWAPNVDHSSLTTAQAEGVGAVRRVQVGRNALLERVTGWEPGQQLAYQIDGLPPVVRSVTNTWELTSTGDDTSVSLTTRIDAGSRPPQQLVARVVGRAMAKASRQMLAGLQHHVERGGHESSAP